jgi:hypothetical protein
LAPAQERQWPSMADGAFTIAERLMSLAEAASSMSLQC